MIEREQKFFDQPKRERILYLGRMSFNIPRFLATIVEIKELAVFFNEHKDQRVSIRTQNLYKPVLCPHYPNVLLNKNLLEKLQTDVRKKYELLVFEAIDPKEAIKRGNLWFNKSEGKMGIEYLEGPGTVRNLEKESGLKSVTMTLEELLEKGKGENEFLGYPPSKFISLPFSQFIIEFSIYDHPIGTQQKPEIFWEIRSL
jgi:hypothetical protein